MQQLAFVSAFSVLINSARAQAGIHNKNSSNRILVMSKMRTYITEKLFYAFSFSVPTRVSGVVSAVFMVGFDVFLDAYFADSHVATSVDMAMSDSPIGAATGKNCGLMGVNLEIAAVLKTKAAHLAANDTESAIICHILHGSGPVGTDIFMRVAAAMHQRKAGCSIHQQLAVAVMTSRAMTSMAIFVQK